MSHYPSSAELAAFRRSIGSSNGLRARYMSHPDGTVAHPTTGAWASERQHGIGYRMADKYWSGVARREASAMRSRAYWAAGSPNGWGLFASSAERVSGIPYWDSPIVASDTWSEDEPRHPLPIVYHQSFSILS